MPGTGATISVRDSRSRLSLICFLHFGPFGLGVGEFGVDFLVSADALVDHLQLGLADRLLGARDTGHQLALGTQQIRFGTLQLQQPRLALISLGKQCFGPL